MLFWGVFYPHALSYQEQNQLFLWTGGYLLEALTTCSGMARYLGEFIVQFYYWPWLGALLLGLVFGLLSYILTLFFKGWWKLTALLPIIFVLWQMGDESLTLAYPLSILLVLVAFRAARHLPFWSIYLLFPLLYWLFGFLAWIYMFCCMGSFTENNAWIQRHFTNSFQRRILFFPFLVVPLLFLYAFPHHVPSMMGLYSRYPKWGVLTGGYDSDRYELIRQDYLIRNERWEDIIQSAEKRVVPSPFWSESVNLALAMTGQLPYRQFDFYQSGRDALIMPMLRDQTSNLPSMEAFYRLGMTNECLRYAFDLQESIPQGRKSGRLCQRIVECSIVKGQYSVARKYLALLKKSLFYRAWALEAESYLGDKARIDSHPVWGELRRKAFSEDFLYYYPDLAQIFYKLLLSNTSNKMALEYMYAQLLLDGNDHVFNQVIGFAQQYGGYPLLPPVYQDAWQCMHGAGQGGSKYGEYAHRQVGGEGAQMENRQLRMENGASH